MVGEARRASTPEPGRPGVQRYAIAIAAAAAGLGLKVALFGWVEAPFILAFPAVAIAAIVGGLGPGLLATALSAVGAWLWVLPPAETFRVPNAAGLASMLLFVAMGAFVSVLADRHRKARDRVAELEREEVARAAEVRARAYVDGAPVAVFVVDGRGRYVDFNPAALDMLGVDAATLLQLSIADVTPPEGRESALAGFRGLVETGRMEREGELLRPDGRRVEILLRAVRVGEDRYAAFCQDFTERKRAEGLLEASERYLRSVIEAALDPFFAMDREGRIVDVNAAASEMLGYSRDELLAMRIADVEAFESPAETAARIERIRVRGLDRFYTRHRRRDGRVLDVAASVRLIDVRGGLMVCFLQDVTERRKAEAELRESEERFASAFQGSPVAMAIGKAESGLYVEVNPAFEEATGFSRDELLGRTPAELRIYANPSDRDRILSKLDATERPLAEEVPFRKRSGQIGTCLVSIRRIRLHGEPHLLTTVVDVTERKRGEEERAALQAKLSAASRMAALGTLVSGVAHEVNNPLAIVTASQGSPGQLEQVVVNLVSNAALAMPDGRRGRIALRVGGAPGGVVRLEVEDDGSGIPPEILERIFDPFFTTRGVGKGTGLGLPICHAIVEAHGGTLEVRSTPGVGSTFRVDLPAAAQVEERA